MTWALLIGTAAAAEWPARPITIVVAYPPGGGADRIARVFGEALSRELGQQVVVENRSGAGGVIGANLAAKSSPDGYTLYLGTSSELTISPAINRQLPYNPVSDFAPIVMIGEWPYILLVNSQGGLTSAEELKSLVRPAPGKYSYSSFGNNTVTHLIGELFKKSAGLYVVHIPYAGSAPSLLDLMKGEVLFTFDSPISSIPHMRSGRLRALAVTKISPIDGVKDLPVLREAGFPEVARSAWVALLAPSGTSPDVVRRLNRAVAEIANAEDFRKKMLELGAPWVGGTPGALADRIRTDIEEWKRESKVLRP